MTSAASLPRRWFAICLICQPMVGLASASAELGAVEFGSEGLVRANVQPAIWLSLPTMTEATATEGLLAARDAESGKVGFLDAKGRWVIAPRFVDAFEFHEGLAAFRLRENGQIGFIDRKGGVVIAARFATNFRTPPRFSEGLAAVGLNEDWPRTNLDPPGRMGYINRSGRWVLQPRYESGSDFKNGVAQVVRGGREMSVKHPGPR